MAFDLANVRPIGHDSGRSRVPCRRGSEARRGIGRRYPAGLSPSGTPPPLGRPQRPTRPLLTLHPQRDRSHASRLMPPAFLLPLHRDGPESRHVEGNAVVEGGEEPHHVTPICRALWFPGRNAYLVCSR